MALDKALARAYWKLDETSGNRADSHTNALTLTDNNTVGSTTGKLGNASSHVAASSEFLSSTSSLLYPGTGDFAISIWFYLLAVGATVYVFVGRGASGDGSTTLTKGGQFGHSGNGQLFFRFGDGSSATRIGLTTATGVVSATTWYHLVVNFDRDGNMEAFLNNSSLGTVSIAAQSGDCNPSASFCLGATSINGGGQTNYHGGYLDECLVYGGLLDSTNRSLLYGAGTPPSYETLFPSSTFKSAYARGSNILIGAGAA